MTQTPDIQAMYERQFAYLNSGKAEVDGSRAIAAGRAAGLAWQAGHKTIAQAIWSKEIPAVVGMPSFAEFCAAYEDNQLSFLEFADPKNFPIPNTAFSNAAGSYAYALDNAARGKAALAGGESGSVGDWGAMALTAAGFLEKAKQLNAAIVNGVLLDIVPQKSPN